MKIYIALLSLVVLITGCGFGPDMSRDRVPQTPSPTPWQGEKPIMDYMNEGVAAYAAQDYRRAAEQYKRAFEMEQGRPRLEKKLWYDLVNNLAMSHTMTGDMENARMVLAHGLSKDYKYAMFHYILARTVGEEGDEGEAIHHLRRAYKNRKSGEKLPDPLTDSSFANISDSESFKRAVAEMKRSTP